MKYAWKGVLHIVSAYSGAIHVFEGGVLYICRDFLNKC